MCHGELVSTKNVHDSSRSAISEPECLTDNLTAEVFPFSLHRSKNLHLRLEQRRLRFQTLNERHQPLTVRLYGEPEVRVQTGINELGIGLCAGLVRIWASECVRGRDAIERLRTAAPFILRTILLSQLHSVYLNALPVNADSLNSSERALIQFKYGSDAAFRSLMDEMNVRTMLELDLSLQYGMQIKKQWCLIGTVPEILGALGPSPSTGLYLLLIRFWDSRQKSAGRGHRIGLLIEPSRLCRFYDSRWGELTFTDYFHFQQWFADYWNTEGWSYFLGRGKPPESPLRIFHLS